MPTVTDRAERLKANHRGAQLAAPASASRLASLAYHKLRYEMLDDGTALVEGEFVFNLAAGHWRSNKDRNCHGYTAIGLVGAIKKRNPEKPPGVGRDSAIAVDPDNSTTDSKASAESAPGGASSDLLPVSKWP
jgi:hypothetical protein